MKRKKIESLILFIIVLIFINSINIMAQTQTISSCQNIQMGGNYILNRDIISSNPSQPCLIIHNINNVHINCNNYKISGGIILDIKNAKDFSVTSCNLDKTVMWPTTSTKNVVSILNGERGIFSKNKINGGYFKVEKSSNIDVKENEFHATNYEQSTSNNNKIEKN